jgi:hypothetical protein
MKYICDMKYKKDIWASYLIQEAVNMVPATETFDKAIEEKPQGKDE